MYTFVTIALAVFCARGALAAPPAFEDATARAGVQATHSISSVLHEQYVSGGAVGDFDRDGWQDLLWLSGGGTGDTPDKLFMNNGDGTFTDRAAEWGLTAVHRGKGAAVGDYNSDGWLDIYVTSSGPVDDPGPGHHKLYRNNGISFTDVAVEAGVNTSHPTTDNGFGATFGDYDLDGDLDLFVSDWSIDFAGSRLYRNDGDGTFTDVTVAAVLSSSSFSFGFSPRFIDTNGDFFPELLLVSDFGSSRYYINNRNGTFTLARPESGVGQEENGMGQAVGDIDNDGLIDWYVTSIMGGAPTNSGNKLYINQGDHSFDEVAAHRGVHDGGVGWAALMIDFNHDGLLDIAETNGTTVGPSPRSYLWIQKADGTFDEVGITAGFDYAGQGRGMSRFDYDNDGDQDIVIFAHNEDLVLFENTLSGDDTGWLRVFLDTSETSGLAPNGYGARVQITIADRHYTQWINSGDHYLSHSELSAHFGIGEARRIDRLTVTWPDGTMLQRFDLAANQTIVLVPRDCTTRPEFRCRQDRNARR